MRGEEQVLKSLGLWKMTKKHLFVENVQKLLEVLRLKENVGPLWWYAPLPYCVNGRMRFLGSFLLFSQPFSSQCDLFCFLAGWFGLNTKW